MKKGKTVAKDLNSEEKALLPDIKALVAKLEQAEQAEEGEACTGNDGGEGAGEVGVGKAAEKDEDMDEEDEGGEDVEKSETGSDDAEERIDELPKEATEALGVLKAYLGSGKSVAKSAQRKPSGSDAALREVAKALNALNKRLDQQEESIVGILEGIGVADEVAKVAKSQSSNRAVQSTGADAQAFLTQLAAMVQKSAQTAGPEKPGTLGDAMSMLVSR
jgi:hypothetical protein